MSHDSQQDLQHNTQHHTLLNAPDMQCFPIYGRQVDTVVPAQQAYSASLLHQSTFQWTQLCHERPPPVQPHRQILHQHGHHWASAASSNYSLLQGQLYTQHDLTTSIPTFASHLEGQQLQQRSLIADPSQQISHPYLSPVAADFSRPPRSTSLASNTSSAAPCTVQTEAVLRHSSRSISPNATEMLRWGTFNRIDETWSCAWPGCASRTTFKRGCDLRKHFKRHTKTLFCRHLGCPQANAEGNSGFSSKKDRARHEASHNPQIPCERIGCSRKFSRQDNMRDHVRRVHKTRT